jgi:hypothetical protein
VRVLVDIIIPNEPFNSMVRAGTVGQKVDKVLADIKPEAIYFTEREGKRGCTMILDIADPSGLPAIAEPFFLGFDAAVSFHPVMTPDDLARAGLEELGKRYG